MNIRLPATLNRLVSPSLALLVAIVLTPGVAHATPYVVKLTQQGNNVVATGSGAIDWTGLTLYTTGDLGEDVIAPALGYLATGSIIAVTGSPADVYTGLSGPTNFGIGSPNAVLGTGDVVGIVGNPTLFGGVSVLFVPQGYDSDTALISGATWNNATLASLGVTPGTYTWTWGTGAADQSFTLMAGVTAVPEPATLGLFGLGMLLLGGFITLRQREQRRF